MRKLAIKVLRSSDLTVFKWHFQQPGNRSKQKAINLNKDVLVDHLYPALPVVAQTRKILIDLSMYGPGHQDRYNIKREIMRPSSGGKNWRLDGEYISNPDDNPSRFNVLAPDDFVIFDFQGDAAPQSLRAVFIARAVPEDASMHAVLATELGGKSMMPTTVSRLSLMIDSAKVAPEHPVNELVLDAALEDAAFEGILGVEALQKRKSGRRMSEEDLQKARKNAESTGHTGEVFINGYLLTRKNAGTINSFEWVSESNAISPYDFSYSKGSNETVELDVKSTAYDFDRPIHVSLSELHEMSSAQRYDLYRVYDIAESKAMLRIAENVGSLAKDILKALDGLPKGVLPDSFSVYPDNLRFGPPVELRWPDEPDIDDASGQH